MEFKTFHEQAVLTFIENVLTLNLQPAELDLGDPFELESFQEIATNTDVKSEGVDD